MKTKPSILCAVAWENQLITPSTAVTQIKVSITNLLENSRQRPPLAETSPSSHSGVLPHEQVIRSWKTDRGNVCLEVQGLVELYKGQVVLVREEVVLGVHYLPGHRPLHVRKLLLDVGEVVLTDTNADLRRQKAGNSSSMCLLCAPINNSLKWSLG